MKNSWSNRTMCNTTFISVLQKYHLGCPSKQTDLLVTRQSKALQWQRNGELGAIETAQAQKATEFTNICWLVVCSSFRSFEPKRTAFDRMATVPAKKTLLKIINLSIIESTMCLDGALQAGTGKIEDRLRVGDRSQWHRIVILQYNKCSGRHAAGTLLQKKNKPFSLRP